MDARNISHDHRPSAAERVKPDIVRALVTTIGYIHRHATYSYHLPGAYHGYAGTAMMDYRVTALNLPELPPSVLFASAEWFLKMSMSDGLNRSLCPSHCSFLETPVGNAALLLHRLLQEPRYFASPALYAEWPAAANRLRELMFRVRTIFGHEFNNPTVNEDDCEVINGLSGLLYACLFLRSSLASSRSNASEGVKAAVGQILATLDLDIFVGIIVERGKAGARAYVAKNRYTESTPGLLWMGHGQLGAARGVAGILHMLLLCPNFAIEPYLELVLQTVEWLVELQDVNGNWPKHAPDGERLDNELVQWSDGAPGVVMLLALVLRRICLRRDLGEKVRASLIRGASVIYTHGLLRNRIGLYDGLAGSVFALLAVADATPDMSSDQDLVGKRALFAAVHLAHLAVDYSALMERGEMARPRDFSSLYEGAAGMCCAWAEVLERITYEGQTLDTMGSGMPAYDDLAFEFFS